MYFSSFVITNNSRAIALAHYTTCSDFWQIRYGFELVYLRQTVNELTAEHTCIMLKVSIHTRCYEAIDSYFYYLLSFLFFRNWMYLTWRFHHELAGFKLSRMCIAAHSFCYICLHINRATAFCIILTRSFSPLSDVIAKSEYFTYCLTIFR